MTDQPALWTLMVYMSGDNVLDNFAIESLKQLRDGAGKGVTVHYLFDPNYQDALPRIDSYDGNQKNTNASVFAGDATKKEGLAKALRGTNLRINTADPEVLTTFINSVTRPLHSPAGADDKNRHYGLILWGHGPELLLDADQPSKDRSGARVDGKYLTPAKLRLALKDAELPVRERPKAGLKPGEKAAGESFRKLDFIALDACSMSMVEVAAELQDYADFMIASQDDVPDQSFPYDKILSLLQNGGGARESCRQIPQEYKNAFQDYFPAPGPAVTNITLASLDLQNIKSITVPLKELAIELRRLAFSNEKARKAIIHARSASRDFVLGLFVDIDEFCLNLAKENLGNPLNSACERIHDALKAQDALILNNQTNEPDGKMRCHGLSIYLPYLTAEESKNIEESLTIGGTGLVTQVSKGGSTTNLHKSRAARIAETEKDLASLTRFNGETNWEDFIKYTWSYILAKEEPMELDLHYSAQQCMLNLLSLCEASSKSSGVAA